MVGFTAAGDIVSAVEVKIHSNINWARYGRPDRRSQLDHYAESLGPACHLFLLSSEGKLRRINRELVDERWPTVSQGDWTRMTLADLASAVTTVLGGSAPERSDGADLLVAIARLQGDGRAQMSLADTAPPESSPVR